jgi:hypothetical protein
VSYPVYSERVLYNKTPSSWKTVTVPENYRLVIKSVTVTNQSAAPAWFFISSHGYTFFFRNVPATESATANGLMVVCYERESVAAYCGSSEGAVSVHGFLFADNGERIEFPPGLLGDDPERPSPAPRPTPRR